MPGAPRGQSSGRGYGGNRSGNAGPAPPAASPGVNPLLQALYGQFGQPAGVGVPPQDQSGAQPLVQGPLSRAGLGLLPMLGPLLNGLGQPRQGGQP